MISVIVSTRSVDEIFVEMVKKTSGIKDIEVLIYENNNETSLTKLYNKGLNESKNDIVVFMHDDVEIKTKNWGITLLNHYNKTDYGIIGVAGTKHLNETGVWWYNKESMYGRVSHTDGKKTWLNEYSHNFAGEIKDVVVIDGVFMSCSKSRIKCYFDEKYDGFHFYDISFSFDNFKNGVKIGVLFDIMLVHKSVGATNDKWEQSRLQFIKSEVNNLPSKSQINVHYKSPNVRLKKEKKIAIVIPTKNKVDELLRPCVYSIAENTSYENYVIYIADTGSNGGEITKTKDLISELKKEGVDIRLIEYDYYNFAKINNDMVKDKIDEDTELILFCNNDIELINDAVSIMVESHEKYSNIGTVGCRLHYEQGDVQHLGIVIGVNEKNEVKISHRYLNWDNDNIRHQKSESFTHGNTAAFMLISKNLFNEIGGFNEIYDECFEDVELNLLCLLKNKVNVTNNVAACYHLESQTRTRVDEDSDLKTIIKFINLNPKLYNLFNKVK